MSTWVTAWSYPLAERAGWILLHSIWQGAIIGGGFGVVRFAARRQSPEVRYLAGCIALVLLVIAPTLTLLVGAAHSPRSATGSPFAGIGLYLSPSVNPGRGSDETYTKPEADRLLKQVADFCEHLAPPLALTWLAGVVVGSLRLTRSWWWVRSLRTRQNEPVDAVWLETLADLRCRLEITRPVRLLKSALVEVPTVIGWLRPVILLPAASITGLTPGQLEAILAHELAHVRRFDYIVNACQCLIETLMFYHPVVWWVSQCVREEREHCCDDLVVKVCGDRLAYARALATLEENRGYLPQLAFAASGGSLLNRIRRLLGAGDGSAPATARQIAGLGILGIGLLLILLGVFFILSPSRYRSTARILVRPESAETTEDAVRTTFSYDPYFIQTEFEVIRSEAVLERAIESLDLRKVWAGSHTGGAPLSASEALAMLRSRLELRPIRNTSLIEIVASSPQPEEAANIANAVAKAFRDHRRELQVKLRRRGMDMLTARFEEQAAKIRDAQTNVDYLRDKLQVTDMNGSADMPTTVMTAETLRKIEALRIERKADFKGLETMLKTLTNLPPDKLRETLPTAAQDSLLGSLLEQYSLAQQRVQVVKVDFGPENPELRKAFGAVEELNEQIDRRVDGIITGLKTRLTALSETQNDLEQEIQKARINDIETARQSRPYFEAKHELAELQKFRQVLTMKIAAENIDLSLPKSSSMVELVDLAMPGRQPSSPNRPRASAMILLGALLDLAGLRMLSRRPK